MDLLTANDRQGSYPASFYAAHNRLLAPLAAAKGTIDCDVCVIGGGFTGLSSAYHLAARGFDVVLVEAQRLGFGASGRNGGQVGRGQRRDQASLERMVGREDARKLWDIAEAAVGLVRELAADPKVATPFHPGVIHTDHRPGLSAERRAEVDHLRQHYGVENMIDLDRAALGAILKSPAYLGGTLDLGSGHLDPLGLTLGLARLATANGARIFERSRVTNITRGSPALVSTGGAQIKSRYVVVACNGYLGNLMPEIAARVMPINNFIVATRPLDTDERHMIMTENYAVADSKFVVNYFRLSDDHRLLFGGTESYGYRFPADIAAKVRRPLAEIFPQLADIEIDYAWGGTLGITVNRMPHFLRLGGNILSASGYSGHGVAMASFAGKMIADALIGQAEQFDAMARVPTQRFPGGTIMRHPLLVGAMLWYQLRDKLG